MYTRLEALTEVLLRLDHVSGYCYDPSEGFDMARIAANFRRKRHLRVE